MGDSCLPCNATCALCDSLTTCTACQPHFNLTDGKCDVCDNGYFRMGDSCLPCNATCALCDSLTTCTACQPHFNLTDGKCDVCDNGYFRTNDSCVQCKATCTLCSSLEVCTSCKENFILQNGLCEVCQSGYYRSQDSCLKCSEPCTECSQSATYCTACISPFLANNGECNGCSAGFFLSNSSGNYCLSTCPEGFELNQTSSKCVSLPNNTLAIKAESIGNVISGFSTATSAAISASSAATGGFSSRLMMCLVATEAIVNMQYLNIRHSKTGTLYYQRMSQSLVPNWFSSLNTNNSNSTVLAWGSFQKNSVSSLYLDNHGDTLIETLFSWILCLLLMLFTFIARRGSRIGSLIFKFYLMAFSFAISNLLGQLQSQTLFFILQVKDNFFFDGYSKLSLVIGYLTMIFTILALIYWFYQLRMIYKHKIETRNATHKKKGFSHKEKWRSEKYGVLWSDFKDDSKLRFFFMYWIVLFNIVYILLIFGLQDVPLAQCSLIVVWTVMFIAFSVAIRPFTQLSTILSHYFNLGCILTVEAMNLYLALQESQDPHFSEIEDQGKAIVYVVIANTAINMLASLIGVAHELYQYIVKKKMETIKKHSKNLKSHGELRISEFELRKKKNQRLQRELSRTRDQTLDDSMVILQERERQPNNFMLDDSRVMVKRNTRKNACGTRNVLNRDVYENAINVHESNISIENEPKNRRRVTFKVQDQHPIGLEGNPKTMKPDQTHGQGNKLTKPVLDADVCLKNNTNIAKRRRTTEAQLNRSEPFVLVPEPQSKDIVVGAVEKQKNQLQVGAMNLGMFIQNTGQSAERRKTLTQIDQLTTKVRNEGNSKGAERRITQLLQRKIDFTLKPDVEKAISQESS